jgi:hypothetical protein
VLYNPNPPLQQDLHQRRHHCRNPRCRAALETAAPNRLGAFCCRGCFASFFRSRCLVCERPITRKNERQKTCRRPKCRSEFKRHRERFSATRYPSASVADICLGNPIKSGLKSGLKSGRAWCIWAGPDVTDPNIRIPLDPGSAARMERLGVELALELERKAGRPAAKQKALIGRRTPPVNILGGYKFPGAPAVHLNSTTPTITTTKMANSTAATGAGEIDVDDLRIPEFLQRGAS